MELHLEIDGALALYEVSETEVLTNELFTTLVVEARKHGVLNLDILLPIEHRTDRDLLTDAGFVWAGTQQFNRDNRAVTFIIFRSSVKPAGDGVTTFGNTTLAPTAMESEAISEMARRMSAPVDEARIKALQEGRLYDDQGYRL
jgi:hypothetical protein